MPRSGAGPVYGDPRPVQLSQTHTALATQFSSAMLQDRWTTDGHERCSRCRGDCREHRPGGEGERRQHEGPEQCCWYFSHLTSPFSRTGNLRSAKRGPPRRRAPLLRRERRGCQNKL